MLYAALALLIPVLLFLPWWAVAVTGFLAGWLSGPRFMNAVFFSAAAGIVSVAIAFVKDGMHGGVISQRMSGLFGLPQPFLIFGALFMLAFLTAFLPFQAGAHIGRLYKSKAVSASSAVSK